MRGESDPTTQRAYAGFIGVLLIILVMPGIGAADEVNAFEIFASDAGGRLIEQEPVVIIPEEGCSETEHAPIIITPGSDQEFPAPEGSGITVGDEGVSQTTGEQKITMEDQPMPGDGEHVLPARIDDENSPLVDKEEIAGEPAPSDAILPLHSEETPASLVREENDTTPFNDNLSTAIQGNLLEEAVTLSGNGNLTTQDDHCQQPQTCDLAAPVLLVSPSGGTNVTVGDGIFATNESLPGGGENGTIILMSGDAILSVNGTVDPGTANGTMVPCPLQNGATIAPPNGLHDPPLNGTNWQTSLSGQHSWIITVPGYYPVDWYNDPGNFTGGMLTTSNPYAILIQASNVILDGMGLVLKGAGASVANQVGILVNGGSQNVQVSNFSIMNMDYGVYYDTVTFDPVCTASGGGLPATPVANEISGMKVFGNEYGVYIKDSENVTVTGVAAVNNTNTGITVVGSDAITVIGNSASNTGGSTAQDRGIAFFSTQHSVIANNSAHDNTLSGIYLNNAGNNTLSGNAAGNVLSSSNQDYGIHLLSSHSNTIQGGSTNDNSYAGVYLQYSHSNIISGNSAGNLKTAKSQDFGIILLGSSNSLLSKNTAAGNSQSGFSLSLSDQNTLVSNTASGNTLNGFSLLNSNQSILDGNTASGNAQNGFSLSSSHNTTLTGNLASGNTLNGFSLLNSNYARLDGNDAENQCGDGFNLTGSTFAALGGNTASINGRKGFSIVESSNLFLNGNSASGNVDGFLLMRCPGVILSSNSAMANRGHGFIVESASSPLLAGNEASGNGGSGFVLSNTSSAALFRNTATTNKESGFILNGTSPSSTFMENVAFENHDGIVLAGKGADSTTLIGNIASGNSRYGISLLGSGSHAISGNTITGNGVAGIFLSSSGENLIHDNYFSNWNNTGFTGIMGSGQQVYSNTWNISVTEGPNIIGGLFMGGNFWGSPAGTGWSEVTYANADGFTIQPFLIAPGNTDHLPLGRLQGPPDPPPPPGPAPDPGGFSPAGLPGQGTSWSASFESHSIPARTCAGASIPVTVTVHNPGPGGWMGPSVALGAYNEAAHRFSPTRIAVPEGRIIGRGQSWTFTFDLTAPRDPGIYTLQYSMVRGERLFFGEVLEVTVMVSDCRGPDRNALHGGTTLATALTSIPDLSDILRENRTMPDVPVLRSASGDGCREALSGNKAYLRLLSFRHAQVNSQHPSSPLSSALPPAPSPHSPSRMAGLFPT